MSTNEVLEVNEVSDVSETPEPSAVVAIPETPIAPVVDLPVIPSDSEFRALAMQAKMLSGSSLVPSALRGKPHDVLLILMTGRDLGVAPTAALRKCYVVDGQVTIAPALKNALVKIKGLGAVRPPATGDPDFPNNARRATAIAYDQSGHEIGRFTVAWEDVEHITINSRGTKLVEKDNWRNYPGRMLWWRASGYLVDDLWPEVSFGIYTPDEIGAVTDEEGHVIDVREVAVVDGYDTSRPVEVEMVADDVAARLTERCGVLPDEAKEVLRGMFREREIRGSFFSQTAAKAKVIEAMVTGVEKRAQGGEWGDWSKPVPEGVDVDGVVGEPQVEGEPVTVDAPAPVVEGLTAADVDESWDAAMLCRLDVTELVKVDPAVLIDACMEWDVEIPDPATPLALATALDIKASEAF